jgi:dTDP-4-dehydrorhamnose 3,5-epimerase
MVRAIRGAVFDVIIDLRPDSPTYQEWIGVELSAQNHRLLYVPENFAHGFQTLTNDTEILYQVSQFYTPGAERGIRYDDPAFAIEWPLDVSVISEKDRTWTDFQEVFAVR